MYKFSHHVQEVFGLMHVKLNGAEFSALNKLATTSAVNSAKKALHFSGHRGQLQNR